MAKKYSQFPTASSVSQADSVVGLHDGENSRFSLLTIFSYLQTLFVPTTRKVNNKALSSNITLDASDVGAVDTDNVGVADGVASLDSNGKVPGTQLDLSGKQSTITASGILKGDGAGGVSAATAGTDYQAPLTFDNTPTASSNNPVKSGGVYTDVRTRVPNYGKGKNLLRNWYFVGGGTGRGVFPVNQRGKTSYSGDTSIIDGWTADSNTSITFGSSGMTVALLSGSSTNIYQRCGAAPLGKALTLSVLTSTGLATISGTMPSTLPSNNQTVLTVGASTDGYRFRLYLQPAGTMYVEFRAYSSQVWVAAQLELGSDQTLAHQENGTWVLNEIPDYEYELYRCMTSTADPSDTYANKSLATEQQLAYVESGTTATKTGGYTAGEYICWQGTLYTANTNIAYGTTLSAGTGGNLTAVVGGGFNNVNYKKSIISTSVILEISGRTAVLRSKGNGATSTDIRNALIPQIYRPSSDVTVPFAYYNGSTWVNDGRCIGINSSTGAVVIVNLSGGIDTSLSFNFSTFCATWFF